MVVAQKNAIKIFDEWRARNKVRRTTTNKRKHFIAKGKSLKKGYFELDLTLTPKPGN